MSVNYKQSAQEVLKSTKFQNDEVEIVRLASQMQLISEHGMEDMNRALLNRRKLFDFIAEHNLASDLIGFDPISTLLYEPSCYSSRPIDFVRHHANSLCFIQMKRLNDSEADNRKRKMLDRLTANFKRIPVGKFIELNL
ncbi:hypothetical protein ABHN11_31785 [Brevibacillus centrosporus]|jgi:hypothetical protein|uniref:hypothetical protein n=1 Tax=Brevibacillus centrosporus TaxID=54910 RepID=UPI003986884E